MNVPIFLAGVGVGVFVFALLFFWILGCISRDNARKSDRSLAQTEILLLQQKRICLATERLADAAEKLSVCGEPEKNNKTNI